MCGIRIRRSLLDGEALQPARPLACAPRVKVFDYGVISFALSQPVSGGWDDLAAMGERLGALETQVQGWCDDSCGCSSADVSSRAAGRS